LAPWLEVFDGGYSWRARRHFLGVPLAEKHYPYAYYFEAARAAITLFPILLFKNFKKFEEERTTSVILDLRTKRVTYKKIFFVCSSE